MKRAKAIDRRGIRATYRATIATAMLFAVAAQLSCGGAESQNEQSTKLTKLTVGDVPQAIPGLFTRFGIEQGIFRKNGLRIETTPGAGGAAIIPGVVSGDLQLGAANLVSDLLAASKGLPIKVVAPGTHANSPSQEESRGWAGILVPSDSSITSPKDLEGKAIAVNTLDNVATLTAKEGLSNAGVDISRLKFLEIPFPEMLAALNARRVDAVFVVEPFLTRGLAEGNRAVAYPYLLTQPGIQIGAYVSTERYINENPDVISAFQQAVVETAQLVRAEPEEFRDFLSQEGNIDAEIVQKLVLPTWETSVDVESIKTYSRLMVKYGLLEKEVPPSEVLAPGAAE